MSAKFFLNFPKFLKSLHYSEISLKSHFKISLKFRKQVHKWGGGGTFHLRFWQLDLIRTVLVTIRATYSSFKHYPFNIIFFSYQLKENKKIKIFFHFGKRHFTTPGESGSCLLPPTHFLVFFMSSNEPSKIG